MHDSLAPDQLYITVDLLIMTVHDGRLNLLLSRRGNAPYQGCWALPGRFVGMTESAEKTAKILLDHMLPLEGAYLEQLYTFTDVGRDPRGRVISTAYLVIAPWSTVEKALPGKTSFRCFRAKLKDGEPELRDGWEILTAGDLAFDHGKIIATGLNRLQGKIDYTDIGFFFLEDREAFSLSELQTVYEAVLGTPLDGSNFRRSIMARYERNGRLEQTERAERRDRGRPAALYRIRL